MQTSKRKERFRAKLGSNPNELSTSTDALKALRFALDSANLPSDKSTFLKHTAQATFAIENETSNFFFR